MKVAANETDVTIIFWKFICQPSVAALIFAVSPKFAEICLQIFAIFMRFKRVCQLIEMNFQDDVNVIKQMMHGWILAFRFFLLLAVFRIYKVKTVERSYLNKLYKLLSS